jgi:Cytochrome P460
MKPFLALIAAVAAIAAVTGFAGKAAAPPADPDAPVYTADGRLSAPADYREWVFLSAGIDMNYSETPAAEGAHVFDNVFAPRAAYAAFKATGIWPDRTVLILEIRNATSKGSINRFGQFQTGEVIGLEAHVKDAARFEGGWGFFDFEEGRPAALIPASANCYSCHEKHGAADTTFVQFYPTLLPVARQRGTLRMTRPTTGQ